MMYCRAVIVLLLYASSVSCDEDSTKDYYERRKGNGVFAIKAVACAIGFVLFLIGCIWCYTKYCNSGDEDEQQEDPVWSCLLTETQSLPDAAPPQATNPNHCATSGGNPEPSTSTQYTLTNPCTAPYLSTATPCSPPRRPSYESYPSESLPSYDQAVMKQITSAE